MTCAVVEHSDGSKTHHTNVISGGLRLQRGCQCVRLVFLDGSVEHVEKGIAVCLVDDQWYSQTQLGLKGKFL